MKYLLTIIIIVLTITVITVYFNWPEQDITEEDVLVIVNNHKLPRSLLDQKRSHGGHHGEGDHQALLDTIIINELLIQEAQRLKIHLEPSFRQSVQNYYEQSLIKILIDRQFNDMKVNVSDEEIDRYISNYTRIFTYTLLTEKNSTEPDFTKSVPFIELSDFLKLTLNSLAPGESATVYSNSGETTSYRLDKSEPNPDLHPYRGNRESAREIIANYKQERELTAWIKELRDQANIIFPDQTEKP